MPDKNIVAPEELEYFVKSIRSFAVVEIGSTAWIQNHEIMLKLNQQAHIDVVLHQEEAVKEFLVIEAKLPVLVNELFTIIVWRCKVLPRLLEIEPNPSATFMLYTVLFHEATVISLIEICLFHQNGCESLADSVLDLIDYCLQSLTQLIGLVNVMEDRSAKSTNETVTEELERQKRDLLYKIGISCISVLCYIVDKLDVLSLSVVTRLIHTHDTPCVLSEILHCRPWRRSTVKGIELMIDNEWKLAEGDELARITKTEAQTWICFRQLMFNGNVGKMYAINEARQRELAKCQGLINEQLIDQLPPLAEFKHYLCTLQLSGNRDSRVAFQLEELPEIKANIMRAAKTIGYKEIAKRQADIFLNKSMEEIVELAKQLNAAYGSDSWERMVPLASDASHECGNCKKMATKKCYQCGKVYYCCRECQVTDWPQHKPECRSQN